MSSIMLSAVYLCLKVEFALRSAAMSNPNISQWYVLLAVALSLRPHNVAAAA